MHGSSFPVTLLATLVGLGGYFLRDKQTSAPTVHLLDSGIELSSG